MLPRSVAVYGKGREPGEAPLSLPESHRPKPERFVARVASSSTSTTPMDASDADASDDASDGCVQMKHVGAWGKTPNLYLLAPHDDQLRRHPRFVALPPVDRVLIGGERTYRFVRQGTELWDALHDGRLTTALLKAALGFCEEGTCAAVGMNARNASHGPAVGAYHRLRTERVEFPSSAPPETETAVNEEVVRAYNEEVAAAGPAAPLEDETSTDDASASGGGGGRGRGRGKRKGGRGGKPRNGGSGGGRDAGGARAAATPWSLQRAARSRRAATRGEGGVRMAWGSAQEAGTVASLMLHFPSAVAEEVGLCVVDRSDVPSAWNVGPLPPMGASPDWMLTLPIGNDAIGNDASGDVPTERLVLEVKNSSPFARHRTRPGKYVVIYREPYDAPPAYHVPQLLLEMLATGATAGLLAMQSATRGVRVFRVERDDEYLAAMLRRVLYTGSHTTPFAW